MCHLKFLKSRTTAGGGGAVQEISVDVTSQVTIIWPALTKKESMQKTALTNVLSDSYQLKRLLQQDSVKTT
jgi:hypothetical protein